MSIDPTRLVQSLYVPVSDGVRIAVDVWLPVERLARGERIGALVRGTRYHRANAPADPSASSDSNYALGRLWTDAGFALVLIDARGTGASFGTRTIELGRREIADYGEIVDWVAGQPWSSGRVGVFGTSYEGQAAELLAGSGNPHIVAVAALFSPLDPYRELFYPGGCATSGRFARWMSGSRILDGIDGARSEYAAATGLSPEELPPFDPVKPVDGPAGPALLAEAIAEHQGNVDVRYLMGQAPFSSDQLPGLDWPQTTPAVARPAIEAAGIPLLVRAGWLDGAFAAGAVRRFATFANAQEVEIGPWGHGGGTFADPLLADGDGDGELAGALLPEEQDRRLVEFFTRYVELGESPPAGKRSLTFRTLGAASERTVSGWPAPGADVRRWHLNGGGSLDPSPSAGAAAQVRHAVSPAESSGPVNRWLAVDLGRGAAYPDRAEADRALLTFTSAPLPADLEVVGFTVVTLRLSTTGLDGAVYVYLESVGPAGEVAYVTEGSLRFVHRAVAGPVDPAGLGVPRTFARAAALAVESGQEMDLVVELLPVAALLRAGDRIRVAVAGHDASCFERYGPPDETFTVQLGEPSTLDLPVLAPAAAPEN